MDKTTNAVWNQWENQFQRYSGSFEERKVQVHPWRANYDDNSNDIASTKEFTVENLLNGQLCNCMKKSIKAINYWLSGHAVQTAN